MVIKLTRIISGFPGIGKSLFVKQSKKYDCLDSDSSNFSWIKDEAGNNTTKRNPDFLKNYIKHIKNNIGKKDFIFVSSHKVVRDALLQNCMFFYLIYPDEDNKKLYIQRYKNRGSDDKFIELVNNNFEKWIKECDCCVRGCKRIKMLKHNNEPDDIFMEIRHIVASENGDSLRGDK